jgi:hypothetical protein
VNAYGRIYVIDNNALVFIKREHRASNFFKQYCRIPIEVLHEADGFPDIDDLRQLEYPVTAGVLAWLTAVMDTVPVNDTALVNLYHNQGNADPLVVATALDGNHCSNDGALFGPTWTVVSGDEAVQNKAREFGLDVMTNPEFLSVLEGESQQRPC